jgi:hypothetical protein
MVLQDQQAYRDQLLQGLQDGQGRVSQGRQVMSGRQVLQAFRV